MSKKLSARQVEVLKQHQFRPRQSGNPSGLPGGRHWWHAVSGALQDLLAERDPSDREGRTYAERIASSLVRAAINGDVRAAAEVLDRTEGRPAQQLHVSGPSGALTLDSFRNMTDDELRAHFQELDRKLRETEPVE